MFPRAAHFGFVCAASMGALALAACSTPPDTHSSERVAAEVVTPVPPWAASFLAFEYKRLRPGDEGAIRDFFVDGSEQYSDGYGLLVLGSRRYDGTAQELYRSMEEPISISLLADRFPPMTRISALTAHPLEEISISGKTGYRGRFTFSAQPPLQSGWSILHEVDVVLLPEDSLMHVIAVYHANGIEGDPGPRNILQWDGGDYERHRQRSHSVLQAAIDATVPR